MSTPLLVVIGYCSKDFDLTKKLLQRIADLGDPAQAALLLCTENTMEKDKRMELRALGEKAFESVETMLATIQTGGWAPNQMFLAASRQVRECYKFPFLWLEPDCVPLKPLWLSQLTDAYADCPKKFLGAIVHQEKDSALPRDHMTGCGIYPQDAYDLFNKLAPVVSGAQAWDIGGANAVMPRCLNTPLIQHYWGTAELPPVFVAQRTKESPINHLTTDFLKPEAVFFHRDKTGSLYNLLNPKASVHHEPVKPSIMSRIGLTKTPAAATK